eukprot:4935571-Amphidinium_carterae.1
MTAPLALCCLGRNLPEGPPEPGDKTLGLAALPGDQVPGLADLPADPVRAPRQHSAAVGNSL